MQPTNTKSHTVFDRAIDTIVVLANRPVYLSLAAAGVVCLGGAGYAVAEGEGPITSLWWAVITASTVGYGDAYPETTFGRGVATVLIILMVTLIIPMITASFTSKLIVDRDAFTHEEQEEIKATLLAIAERLDAPSPGSAASATQADSSAQRGTE